MEQIEFIFKSILEVAAFITAIGAAVSYIRKWNAERRGTKNTELIAQHTEQLKQIDKRLTELENANKKQDQFVEKMCSAMLALLEHAINGNSTDKLKTAKADLQDFLIHRG